MSENFLSEKSSALISELITKQRSTEEYEIKTARSIGSFYDAVSFNSIWSKIHPTIPPMGNHVSFKESREKLPINQYRTDIISAMDESQVVIVSGETGKKTCIFVDVNLGGPE